MDSILGSWNNEFEKSPSKSISINISYSYYYNQPQHERGLCGAVSAAGVALTTTQPYTDRYVV